MNDALYIAATGMRVQQTNVDTIANNLVNANTPGFKRNKVAFTDMVATQAGAAQAGDGLAPAMPAIQGGPAGVGVMVTAIGRELEAGELKKTGSALDVAIRGEGFLEVSLADGTRAFTRGGTLKVNRDGLLSVQSGAPLKPAIAVPDNVQALSISAAGRVEARIAGQDAPLELGQLDVLRFANPDQLTALGDNLYGAGAAAGEPLAGEGAGSIAQGYLENSNVKLVDEMVNLVLAQRAYEVSAKVIQAADEMHAAANNLRK